MAVNKNNVRMQLTFSKKQADWLRRCAKKCNLQISDFVKWLIDKNISRYFAKLNYQDQVIINKIKDDREYEQHLPTIPRNDISQEEWDHLFDGREPQEKQYNDDEELPF